MSACPTCHREMLTALSCGLTVDHVDGVIYQRVPYGKDQWVEGEILERCAACGVQPGGIHHRFCDREQCACCQGQWLSCACELDR